MKYCPNCQGELHKPNGTAQGIRGCETCGGRWLIVETTKPKMIEHPDDYLNNLIKQASPTWKGVDVEKYLDEVRGGVESLTTEMVDQIAEEIEAQHPYKIPGRHETFDRYNEGWSDACSVLADRIKEALK